MKAPENRPKLPPKPKAPRPSNHQFSGAKMLVFRGGWPKQTLEHEATGVLISWCVDGESWLKLPALKSTISCCPKNLPCWRWGGWNFRNRLFGTKIGLQKSFVMEDFGMFSGCCHLCCVLGTVNINHLTSDKTSNFWFCVFFSRDFLTLPHGGKKWQQASPLQVEKMCEHHSYQTWFDIFPDP